MSRATKLAPKPGKKARSQKGPIEVSNKQKKKIDESLHSTYENHPADPKQAKIVIDRNKELAVPSVNKNMVLSGDANSIINKESKSIPQHSSPEDAYYSYPDPKQYWKLSLRAKVAFTTANEENELIIGLE